MYILLNHHIKVYHLHELTPPFSSLQKYIMRGRIIRWKSNVSSVINISPYV